MNDELHDLLLVPPRGTHGLVRVCVRSGVAPSSALSLYFLAGIDEHRFIRRRLLVLGAVVAVTGAVAVLGARAETRRGAAAGPLEFRAEVLVRYPPAACPSGTPRLIECFDRTGDTTLAGLGAVHVSYAYVLESTPLGCSGELGADVVRLPPTTARLTVEGKGEIFLLTEGTGCLARAGTLRSTEGFTVTGGSGSFSGASGGGTLASQSNGPPAYSGFDTWSGTLVVPGMQFDVTAPVISGATDRKVLVARRAKGVRVTHRVTARDDVDGVVPVSCIPKSGSRFGVGRTRVTCTATDKSANKGTATFTVRVARRR